MYRKLRPWLPFLILTAAVVVLIVYRFVRKPPIIPVPVPSDTVTMVFPPLPNPPTDPSMLPAYLENVLRSRGMEVRLVARPDEKDFYDLYAGPWEASHALALVEVLPGESSPPVLSAPDDYRVGPYHIVGNPALMTRVRQALPQWEAEEEAAP